MAGRTEVAHALERHLGIRFGETTPDGGEWSIEVGGQPKVGTSFAAAYVTGIIACALSGRSGHDRPAARQVMAAIVGAADRGFEDYKPTDHGAGIVRQPSF